MVDASIVRVPANFKPMGGKDTDRVALLLDDVLHRTSRTKERRSGEWIPYGRDTARPLHGAKYAATIKVAAKRGAVERNEAYLAGEKSKSLRLTERYRDGRFKKHRLKRRRKRPPRIRIAADDSVGTWLVSKFELFRLPHLESLSPWCEYSADCLRDGDHYANRCRYGRLHSSYTSMEKTLRRRLRCDSAPLVELDIANCQPLLIGILATQKLDHIWSKRGVGAGVVPLSRRCRVAPGCEQARLPADLAAYLELSQAGLLYEHLLDCSKKAGLTNRDRCTTKKAFNAMTFANNKMSRRMAIRKVVAAEFPTLIRFMESAKAKCHKNLAHLSQRFESGLMIDTVCGRLMDDCPEIPILTVHDCILTTESNVAVVRSTIEEVFAANGIRPTIHEERYDTL